MEPEKDGDTEIKDTDIETELDDEEHCREEPVEEQLGVVVQEKQTDL